MTTPPIPYIPETAPFTAEQRAWLNGYLAGLFARTLPGDPAAAPAAPAPPPPRTVVTVLFATQTGNAESLAKLLARRLSESGFEPRLLDAAQATPEALASAPFVLALASTYGDGDPPDAAKPLWDKLNATPAPALASKFSVFALGDSSYARFCQFGRDLDRRLEELGGRRVSPRVECDVDPDAAFAQWSDAVIAALAAEAAASPAPPSGVGQASSPVSSSASAVADPRQNGASAPGTGRDACPTGSERPAYSRKNPFPARLLTNRRLSGSASDKDTRHLEISIEGSGIAYEVGDALAVQPKNRPVVVDAMLARLGLTGAEPTPGADGAIKPLRWALLEDYEMTKISPKLLAKLADRAGDKTEADRLAALSSEEMRRLTWGREVYDFLMERPGVFFEPAEFVALLKKLHPRLYSIASSHRAHPGQVHLTVAVVRYDREGREHKGTASAWLAERVDTTTPIPVFVQPNKHFRLPADPATPIVMIGPGTGIAPFRAFLEERREIGATGPNWLFFGDRHEATDFLYREELLGMKEEGLLARLDLAFSRDQPEKIYVQHRMLEQARELHDWLERGAHLYVCGDASRMAKDVHEALHEVFVRGGGRTPEQAAEAVKALEAGHRYKRDVY